jgi:N-acetylmuramoyl-L-alanine amidase
LALAVSMTIGLATPASANEWKMEPITQSAEIIQEARELQDTERREFFCLALNIYHEARGESLRGQQAVAHVVLNRRKNGKFPSSICAVVWQRSQFSWTVRPVGSLYPRDAAAWERSQRVAFEAMKGISNDPTNGATHFHTRSIRPGWSFRGKTRFAIGAHVFIRMWD